MYQLTYLQLSSLVDERGRQVVFSLIQQGAHLLHLLLQTLLHLNHSLENKHMSTVTNRNFMSRTHRSSNTFVFLAILQDV